MKSIKLNGQFGINNLSLIEQNSPKIDKNSILVKMEAASINYVDLLLVKGVLSPDISPNFIPLSDGAGFVKEVGSNVKDFKVGDRVVTTYIPNWIDGRYTLENSAFKSRPGSGETLGQLCEYKLFNKNEIIKAPEFLTFSELSTLPIAALTAWNALAYSKIKAGDTVLLYGTGGVSIFALQFAKTAGAKVIITSSNDEKLQKAKKLGADYLINYHKNPQWIEKIHEITNHKGVDIIVETVGGENLNKSLEVLRLDGNISIVGFINGIQSSLNLISLNLKRAKVHGLSVGSRQDFLDMLEAMEVNKIKPIIDKEFLLKDTKEAFTYLESSKHFGKIVIKI